ncbi:MAG TPA: hypothetical protein VHP58_03480 [Alphaproteobacteria bacterium]|nr:hypothetical protein [Alphaproteobacteria bacterium]
MKVHHAPHLSNQLHKLLGSTETLTTDKAGRLHFFHWVQFLFGFLLLIAFIWLVWTNLPPAVIAFLSGFEWK